MNPLLLADSIGKVFGRTVVLKAATVWAVPGRITVLLGRNGSGKTTLIRAAMGLLRVDHGVVRFDGRSYARPRLWRLASEGLFYLPDRRLMSRRETLADQLRLVAERFGDGRVDEAPCGVDVSRLLGLYADEMSSGERRRAEIALALARRPRCLVADEPLTELAPRDREIVAQALTGLAASGAAVLVTGHEVRELLDMADEVVWMAAGTTHGLGSPAAASAHDQFRREYLGPGFASTGRS